MIISYLIYVLFKGLLQLWEGGLKDPKILADNADITKSIGI